MLPHLTMYCIKYIPEQGKGMRIIFAAFRNFFWKLYENTKNSSDRKGEWTQGNLKKELKNREVIVLTAILWYNQYIGLMKGEL